jgi:hypothetical protein
LGAALADRCFELGWIARIRDSRALKISAPGERGFMDVFGIFLNAEQLALPGAGAVGEKQKVTV